MNRSKKVLMAVIAVFMMLAAIAPVAFAKDEAPPPAEECKSFYLLAAHGINGERLGLPAELPVDVYVNGGYEFTFEFKDVIKAELPAGMYTITVNLAGTDVQVMDLGPVDLEGCTKVRVVAKLVNGVPTLLPKITVLDYMK